METHAPEGGEAQYLTEFFDHRRLPVIPIPQELPANATRVEEALYNLQIKTHAKNQSKLEQNPMKIYSVAFGKCGSDIRSTL